jgi:hypothetical protein
MSPSAKQDGKMEVDAAANGAEAGQGAQASKEGDPSLLLMMAVGPPGAGEIRRPPLVLEPPSKPCSEGRVVRSI